MRPSGKVNLVGVAMLAGLTFGVWWLVTFAPSRLDHLDVKEHVKAAYNAAKAGTEAENQTRGTLLTKLNAKTLGWHMAEDESGNPVRRDGLGIKDEQIVITRDEVTGLLTVTVEYDRVIDRWPLKTQQIKHFVATHTGPLK